MSEFGILTCETRSPVPARSTARVPRGESSDRRHQAHDRRYKKVQDLEVSGRRTMLVWMRRFSYGNCDERFLEDPPSSRAA